LLSIYKGLSREKAYLCKRSKDYIALYSVTETGVLIQAVIQGNRDIDSLFKQ
jgi:hypothetical protein